MKIKKITTKDEELEITEATLLTTEEVEKLPKRLRRFNGWWWLRSPGRYLSYVASVSHGGSVNHTGDWVNLSNDCVRPALKIQNLESSNFEIGDTFIFKSKKFEVVDEATAFCLDDIGRHCFRANWKADDANNYEASDVKKYVDDWFNGVK